MRRSVWRWTAVATLAVALVATASHAHGQKATERFIPVGQSPGLSGKVTYYGTIESADAGARTIAVGRDGGRRAFAVTDATRIWLDRSRLKRTTLDGSFADLRPGRRIEVMPAAPGPGTTAEWIKVEVTAADAPGR